MSNLVIVESPAKAKTIEGFLGKDFVVRSCYGHIRELPKKGDPIDIENKFKPTYIVPSDKKKVVSELNKIAKNCETVWLATDEDREGEAISWHLKEALKLKPENTRRITFNEITKKAVLKAVDNPRNINEDLVNSQQARRILDRIVGFELSPVLWRKIRPSLSAGRVQSVTVRLIVEREQEIQNHVPFISFKVVAEFDANGAKFKAEIASNFTNEDDVVSFLENAKGKVFKVNKITKKPGKRTPSAPFITSTLQQEASRKLGFNVSRTMSVAQRLYESGKITYMRTDSVSLSNDAMNAAQEQITRQFGANYCNPRKYQNKNKSAQEAHEAIRPSNFSLEAIGDGSPEDKLYQLIWKRTIASQMSDAEIERTNVQIGHSIQKNPFVAVGEMIRFDGFLKVYIESKDDDEDQEGSGLLPSIKEGQSLNCLGITGVQKFSRPPARFTEASLVKKLEDLGIGRPSTYAPTIKTIQDRGYVEKKELEGNLRDYKFFSLISDELKIETRQERFGADRNKLIPTTTGDVVNEFLVEHFQKILDYNFTADVEKELDLIANGDLEWTNMLDKFYHPFHKNIESTQENAARATGERLLGEEPGTGEPVYVKLGKYGPIAQIGETSDESKKPKFASLKTDQNIKTISLDEALSLFQYPKNLGQIEGVDVFLKLGRFGPYIQIDKLNVSVPKGIDADDIGLSEALVWVEEKKKADAPIMHYDELPVSKGKGRFGPFIKWNEMFINVSKKYDFDNLSESDITELIENKKRKEIEKFVHNWEEQGISVQKGRWGRHFVVSGKKKIQLDKNQDPADISLEQAKEMLKKK
ncbi:MAG: DNA topoisomerase I [Crocinitomicaceae bacterium]|nr:DNA topoisomerase I [Crocinitomicaceae bacterium]|tara:strand:+ start:15275 stop:17716 length:2442 start_codon:yes stop_codon:yes gene_type:complete